MSKEFQDECKRLGLTGYQLTAKYKREGKSLEKDEIYVRNIVPRPIYYNPTNTCDRCREEGRQTKLYPGIAHREKDKEGNKTGRRICKKCWDKDYQKNDPNSISNIMKSIRNCRTGNQNPNSNQTKGDKSQELACRLYGWEDLNKKNDNYTRGTPIDCYDPKTGLYHQVQGRYYNSERRVWPFAGFKREWKKIFEYMVCFCFSEDGKIVEIIYKFPEEIVKNKSGVEIYKYDTKKYIYNNGWYEEYIVKDEDELKKANEIWKEIMKQ